MLRLAMMAANTLLRPQARRRLGMMTVLIALAAIFGVIAFGFALSGVYMLLAQAYGPPIGALLTAAILLFIAICLLIAMIVIKKREPPPPMIDPSAIAALGLLAGILGFEAVSSRKKPDKD